MLLQTNTFTITHDSVMLTEMLPGLRGNCFHFSLATEEIFVQLEKLLHSLNKQNGVDQSLSPQPLGMEKQK